MEFAWLECLISVEKVWPRFHRSPLILSAKQADRDSPSSEKMFIVDRPSKHDLTFDRRVGDTEMIHLSSLQALPRQGGDNQQTASRLSEQLLQYIFHLLPNLRLMFQTLYEHD